jgi:hypothetical protein
MTGTTTRMRVNTLGRCPPEAMGKRVRVKLRNGSTFEAPADAPRGAVNWTRGESPFTVVEWELAG